MPSQSLKKIVWTRLRIQASILSHVTLDATLKTQTKFRCISSCQPHGRKLKCMRATVLPPFAYAWSAAGAAMSEHEWERTRKQFNKQAKYFLIGYTKSTIKFSMTDEGMEGLILKMFRLNLNFSPIHSLTCTEVGFLGENKTFHYPKTSKVDS